VVASATRTGSLDANIRGHVANELEALAGSLPELRAVAFNGRTAAAIGRRQLGHMTRLALIELPSSSPAYTLPLSTKLERWMTLRAWLPRERAGRNP
jgi:hypoxanthine-DNA glycosylase